MSDAGGGATHHSREGQRRVTVAGSSVQAHARRKQREVDALTAPQAPSGLTPTVRTSATPAPASAAHPIPGSEASRPCRT
jgi:hypothetical protein